MSADDNVAAVKKIYEAFGKGDVETILGMLSDDVDWAAATSSDAAPWYGARKGKDEVAKFFEQIGGGLEVEVFDPQSFTSNEDGEVMVMLHFKFKAAATGKGAEMDIFHYWHFEDGKVVKYRGTEDTAQTAVALAS